MSSSNTTRLALFKPVPGTSEPFRAEDFNANMDKIDAEAVAADARLDILESDLATAEADILALETAIDGGTP
jgi:hypothetical protein